MVRWLGHTQGYRAAIADDQIWLRRSKLKAHIFSPELVMNRVWHRASSAPASYNQK
jgi:hypothetical protein